MCVGGVEVEVEVEVDAEEERTDGCVGHLGSAGLTCTCNGLEEDNAAGTCTGFGSAVDVSLTLLC